jgi:excisionase family DNA binding protein
LNLVHFYRFEDVMTNTEDRWLSADEISVHLGVVKDTVYRWIKGNGMPAHRIGRSWKFKKDQVDEWVEAGKAQE